MLTGGQHDLHHDDPRAPTALLQVRAGAHGHRRGQSDARLSVGHVRERVVPHVRQLRLLRPVRLPAVRRRRRPHGPRVPRLRARRPQRLRRRAARVPRLQGRVRAHERRRRCRVLRHVRRQQRGVRRVDAFPALRHRVARVPRHHHRPPVRVLAAALRAVQLGRADAQLERQVRRAVRVAASVPLCRRRLSANGVQPERRRRCRQRRVHYTTAGGATSPK